MTPIAIPTAPIGGIPISRLDFGSTLTLLEGWLSGDRPRRVSTANLDFLEIARRDAELSSALTSADLVTADGAPVVWLSRASGAPIPGRVAGSDLVPALLAAAARAGRSVFLLGGLPGSAEEAARRIVRQWPGLRIAGTASPPVNLSDPASGRAAADTVRRARADLVLVGLGCPKQDVFLARHLEDMGCRLGIGVGGTLEFLAGRVRRAPPILGRIGLEWAFRLALEPRRLAGRYARDLVHLGRLASELVGRWGRRWLAPRALPARQTVR